MKLLSMQPNVLFGQNSRPPIPIGREQTLGTEQYHLFQRHAGDRYEVIGFIKHPDETPVEEGDRFELRLNDGTPLILRVDTVGIDPHARHIGLPQFFLHAVSGGSVPAKLLPGYRGGIQGMLERTANRLPLFIRQLWKNRQA